MNNSTSALNTNNVIIASVFAGLVNEEILNLMQSACNNPERVRDISKQRKYNPELAKFDIVLDVDNNEFVIFLGKKGLPIDLVFKADMYDVEYLDHYIIEVKDVSLSYIVVFEEDEEKKLQVDNSNENVNSLINTVNSLLLDSAYYGLVGDYEVITNDLDETRSLIYAGEI